MNAIVVMVVLVVAGIATATHAITTHHTSHTTHSFMATDLDDITRFFKKMYQNENMQFAQTWVDQYQGTGNKEKRNKANDILNKGIEVPEDAMQALIKAGYIFDKDKGFDAETIIDNMSKIGMIESNYTTKRQQTQNDKKGERTGTARGYWQMEPVTAIDLAKNSDYLGDRFNTEFKRYAKGNKTARQTFADMSTKEIGDLLENDTNLAAAFSTAKMITTF